VGLVAFILYQKQKNDERKVAATIILLEIQYAEDHLGTAKESIIKDNLIKEDIFLLPTSSWDKYKYLFVGDFNDKSLADISLFFEKCKAYDKVVSYNNSFFEKNEEQIRTNLHAALADYTKSYMLELTTAKTQKQIDAAHDDYKKLIDGYAAQFMEEVTSSTSQYFYRPVKPLNDAKVIVNTLRTDISSSNMGTTLRNISTRHLRLAIHDFIFGIKKSQSNLGA
jgi:hypothetical protein